MLAAQLPISTDFFPDAESINDYANSVSEDFNCRRQLPFTLGAHRDG